MDKCFIAPFIKCKVVNKMVLLSAVLQPNGCRGNDLLYQHFLALRLQQSGAAGAAHLHGVVQ